MYQVCINKVQLYYLIKQDIYPIKSNMNKTLIATSVLVKQF